MEDTFKKLDKLEDQYKIGKLQLHELVNRAYSMGVNDGTDSVVKKSDFLPCVSSRFSVSKIETADYFNVAVVDNETGRVVCHMVNDGEKEYCIDKAQKIANALNVS